MLLCKFTKSPRSIVLAGNAPARLFSEADLEAAREEGYQRGLQEGTEAEAQRHEAQHAEALAYWQQVCVAFSEQHEELTTQFCQMLPGMVLDALRRVLSTVEIDERMVLNIVSELIGEVHTSTPGLEVLLCERDFKIVEDQETKFGHKHPGICFVADRDLRPGDCMVRSRFGTLDGRIATKLDNVEALLQ